MATLNLAKLETASIILNGVKVGVKRILKTKGEVIMANGERLALEHIRGVGRGFVYEPPKAAGKTSTKPAAKTETKPAAKQSERAPAMPAANGALGRGAPVTADDLPEGKIITTKDGERLAVVLVLPNKGIVKLAGNVRVNLANIVRRGRGFVELDVTDVVPANKPAASKPAATKPAAKTETKPAAPVSHGHAAVDIHTLRGARVKVGGRFQTIEKLFPSKGQVKTAEGTRLEVAHIHQKGSKFFYTAVEEMKPAAKQTEAKPTGGIRRREEPVDVSKPAAKTKTEKAPAEKVHKVKPIEALTADKTEEIRLFLSDFLKTEIGKHFDLKFIASHAMWNDNFTTVELSFGIGSLTPKQMARIMAEIEAERETDTDLLNGSADDEDDSEEDEDDTEEDEEDEEENDEDFDDSELDGSDNGKDESEEDEDDSEEDEDDSEEDESEEDESEEDEDDEFENDDSEEEEMDDIEAKVDAGVAALEKKFAKHSSFRGYAENYLLSDEVKEAFGDDMEIGVTKLDVPGKGTYVLVGLSDDGEVILINSKTSKLKKSTIAAVARMEEV